MLEKNEKIWKDWREITALDALNYLTTKDSGIIAVEEQFINTSPGEEEANQNIEANDNAHDDWESPDPPWNTEILLDKQLRYDNADHNMDHFQRNDECITW